MNTEEEQLKSALVSIRKQKQINGVFNFEGLKAVLSALERFDISYERKARVTTIFCVLSFIGALVLLFMSQPLFFFIAALVGIILLFLAISFRRFDLDNEFRLFVKPVLRLLEEDIKPDSELRVKLELGAPYTKPFFKGKSPKYSKGQYYRCYDYQYEREAAVLRIRLFDGNRLMMAINEQCIRTVKTKRNPRGKIKTKPKYKKLITHHYRLRVNPEKFRCKPLTPEIAAPHQIRVANTTLEKEQIQCLDTNKGQVLDLTFRVKVKGIISTDKQMTVDPGIVPQQILKLYSFLEPVSQDKRDMSV